MNTDFGLNDMSIIEFGEYKFYKRKNWRHILETDRDIKRLEIEWFRGSKGGLFLDIGSNDGLFSICLSKNFDNIIAFEPHPINIEIMKKNLELNGINNVEIVNKALWNSKGSMTLKQFEEFDLVGRVYLTDDLPIDEDKTFVVETTDLDSLNLEPSAIKVNIESAEYEFIDGSMETLKRFHPRLFVEYHGFYGGKLDNIKSADEPKFVEAEKKLLSIGYKVDNRFGVSQIGYV